MPSCSVATATVINTEIGVLLWVVGLSFGHDGEKLDMTHQCFLYVDFGVAAHHGKISAATVSEIGQTGGWLLFRPAPIAKKKSLHRCVS